MATPFSLVCEMEAVLPFEVEVPSLRILAESSLKELIMFVCTRKYTFNIFLPLWFYVICSTFNFLMLNSNSGGGASLASKLRSLSSDCFVHLLSAIFLIVQVIYTWQLLICYIF